MIKSIVKVSAVSSQKLSGRARRRQVREDTERQVTTLQSFMKRLLIQQQLAGTSHQSQRYGRKKATDIKY